MSAERESTIRLGITTGDYNGVGPEVIIKTFADRRLLEYVTPVIYGSSRLFAYWKKALDINGFQYTTIDDAASAKPGQISVVQATDGEAPIDIGQPTAASGEHAVRSIMAGAEGLAQGAIDALVTAPIHKSNVQSDLFPFPGHTEYFADFFQTKHSIMLLVGEHTRVGLVTNHLPISEVAGAISKDLVYSKLRVLYRSLQNDFGIIKPRIAVLGLNPHASDKGLFGNEEAQHIFPAIEMAQEKKALVYGPYPADGFFGASQYTSFDAVLAMYHDQGLIPFKTLHFGKGVNFTAGLPVIRTSPDHGTGMDIAGKGKADPGSFRNAVFQAIDAVRNRAVYGIPEPV